MRSTQKAPIFLLLAALLLTLMACGSKADAPTGANTAPTPAATTEDMTFPELIETMHQRNIEKVIDGVNQNRAMSQMGYTIDTAEGEASITFVDMYITDQFGNKKDHDNSDLVVRYQFQVDNEEGAFLYEIYYVCSDQQYLYDLVDCNDLGDLDKILFDLNENQSKILDNGGVICWTINDKVVDNRNDSWLCFDQTLLDLFLEDFAE